MGRQLHAGHKRSDRGQATLQPRSVYPAPHHGTGQLFQGRAGESQQRQGRPDFVGQLSGGADPPEHGTVPGDPTTGGPVFAILGPGAL